MHLLQSTGLQYVVKGLAVVGVNGILGKSRGENEDGGRIQLTDALSHLQPREPGHFHVQKPNIEALALIVGVQ